MEPDLIGQEKGGVRRRTAGHYAPAMEPDLIGQEKSFMASRLFSAAAARNGA